MMADIRRTVDAVWRIEGGRIVATLAKVVGDVGLAEDLAQEAVADAHELDEQSVENWQPIDDDLLRLVFAACHPVLGREAQVAMTLRVVGGPTRSRRRSGRRVPERRGDDHHRLHGPRRDPGGRGLGDRDHDDQRGACRHAPQVLGLPAGLTVVDCSSRR